MRFGDVTDRATLIPVFEGAEGCRVIHCAGMVSVAAGQGEALGRINVQGTENIAGLCLEYGAKRLVYVSSVHAIPERPMGEVITEECRVSPELVHGAYAKSKAAANKKVLLAAEKGLDAGIVYPSGIIGPVKSFLQIIRKPFASIQLLLYRQDIKSTLSWASG